MATGKTDAVPVEKPLRLWPGVVAVLLQWLAWLGAPHVLPEHIAAYVYFSTGLVTALAVVVWWTFFSRAPWSERLSALVLIVAAIAVTPRFLHVSVARGNMGAQFYFWAVPILSLALVAWAVASRRLSPGPRRAAMVAAILVPSAAFTLLRSEGLEADGDGLFTWRWTETSEERLLAEARDELAPIPIAAAAPDETERPQVAEAGEAPATLASTLEPAAVAAAPADPADELAVPPPAPEAGETAAEWPGFRGPGRSGIIPGLRIETDWSASPPVELWRRRIGPGVSSMAVHGDLLYTHEQRGEDEIVACYEVRSGEPVWRHRDAARFWDAHVGAGPRATPALGDGRVYALGATGILNALDAADGSVVWSRDVASDTGARRPTWGFVSSPLVLDEVVVIHSGKLVAYDLATGEPCWFGPEGGSLSSPHLLTLDGVPQIVLVEHNRVTSVTPTDGTLLWEHRWRSGIGIVQPALAAGGDVLVSMIDDGAQPIGSHRFAVGSGPEGWTTEERWTTRGLKTVLSQTVIHEGHAYGFDGRFVACIDLADGERLWKGGRYGSGQLVLLPDQDLLLVVSEKGELALVNATPDRFTELARFPAIEGRFWNQPALVGDVLLVRNDQEMAAFRLPLAGP